MPSEDEPPLTVEDFARSYTVPQAIIDRQWGIRRIHPFTIKPDYEAPNWDTKGMEHGG